MKFSSSLKFNTIPEWWDSYIAYDALKKYIYQLEKEQFRAQSRLSSSQAHDIEAEPLVTPQQRHEESGFTRLLDRELRKVVSFYEEEQARVEKEVDEIGALVKEEEESGEAMRMSGYTIEEEDEDDDLDNEALRSRSFDGGRKRRRSLSFSQATSPTLRAPLRDRNLSISSDEMEDSLVGLRSSAGSGTLGRLASKLLPQPSSSHEEDDASPWTSGSRYAEDTRLLFKRRITGAYAHVSSLRSFVDVNWEGFRKILKKYDKLTDSSLKDHYLSTQVSLSTPFTQESKAKLAMLASALLDLYAKCVTRGDRPKAKEELRLHQREKVAWERNTVWREMLGRERGLTVAPKGVPRALGGTLVFEEQSDVDDQLASRKKRRVVKSIFKASRIWILTAFVLFIILLNVNSLPDTSTESREEARRCFAILVLATILWASEAIPLFVTSLLIPFLVVTLRVIRDDDPPHTRQSAQDATTWVFSKMFSPTIMLLIGGFTISSALSKTNIDRVLITRVLSVAGTRPRSVLLAFMAVSCFASMWISNVAAPALCFTLIKPILRTLPPNTTFAPCLILAIALAANIGGQSSPISSPQNLISLGAMTGQGVSWGGWFIVSIPVSAISVILIWLLLLVSYKPEIIRAGEGEGEVLVIKPIRPTQEKMWTGKKVLVIIVTIATIAAWCVASVPAVQNLVGDMGVIALVPIVIFFGTGVLGKADFDQFAWTIVFLAMGGISLGKAVGSSGLLGVLDEAIRELVQGYDVYIVVLILTAVVLVVSTFISHTIAAVLLAPIAAEVGKQLDPESGNLLVFITALVCSTGMGMPVSGFPNQTAATQEDDLGQLYLSNVDFLVNGVPSSIISALVVATIGFLLMRLIGL